MLATRSCSLHEGGEKAKNEARKNTIATGEEIQLSSLASRGVGFMCAHIFFCFRPFGPRRACRLVTCWPRLQVLCSGCRAEYLAHGTFFKACRMEECPRRGYDHKNNAVEKMYRFFCAERSHSSFIQLIRAGGWNLNKLRPH